MIYAIAHDDIPNIDGGLEGLWENARDDGDAIAQRAIQHALDFIAKATGDLKPGDDAIPVDFAAAPADAREWLDVMVLNLDDEGLTLSPVEGDDVAFLQITSTANIRRLYEAAEGWSDTTTSRDALIAAYRALEATGAPVQYLHTVASLIAQRGLWGITPEDENEPLLGGRDDYLTSLCDVVMHG